jgi:1-deoxy-D-xylulose-5-phosphate reductoisomerase
MKRVSILGSTGSVGSKTLSVIRDFHNEFRVVGLSTYSNISLLQQQVEEFRPMAMAIVDTSKIDQARALASKFQIRALFGMEGLIELASDIETDLLVVATVGSAGLLPTLKAIEKGITIALANKEVLVMAGELVMRAVEQHRTQIIPIDSEHNAISQCLLGSDRSAIRRLILTASGGPFRTSSREEIEKATLEETLQHPTWAMGPKITVDSATLMNKGFEVIEGHHLFGVDVCNIEVVIHPESIIHSMVEFVDGSILAQLAPTDMYLPIQNALTYPHRCPTKFPSLDFTEISKLTFYPPDFSRFPCLQHAYNAATRGGTMPAVLNAANEVAVTRYLRKEITFSQLPEIIGRVMDEHSVTDAPGLKEIQAADAWAREKAQHYE